MKGQRGNQLLENNGTLAGSHLQSCHEQSIHKHIHISYAILKNTSLPFWEHLLLNSLLPFPLSKGEKKDRLGRHPLTALSQFD